MSEFDNVKKILIGKNISNPKYGIGVITDIYLSDYNIIISIEFYNSDEALKKIFNFVTAMNNHHLYLEDDILNQAYIDLVKIVDDMPKIQMNYSHIEDKSNNANITEYKYKKILKDLCQLIIEEKSISLDLIEFYDDKEFEKELYDFGFCSLTRVIEGTSGDKKTYSIVILLLSYIALKKYNGDLHTHIYEEFKNSKPTIYRKFTQSQVRNGFYKALSNYRKVVKYSDETSYNAVPIILCCVPHYRLEQLFKFSFDIYKKKLLYDDDLDDNKIYENVYETLVQLREKDIIGTDESIKIKGSEYLMSKYTQSCIYTGKCLDSLSAIITNCIRYVINYLTKHEDSFVVKAYYQEAYNAFVDYFEHSNNGKERDKYDTNKIISRPYFRYIDDKVFLVTGELMIDDSFDTENIYMIIYNGEDEIRRIQLNGIGDIVSADEDDFAKNKVARKNIEIKSNVLDYFSYSIICGDVELYNSSKRLYRENIFFDGKGYEVKPGSEYNGDIRVLSKNSNKFEYGEDINEIRINNCFYSSIVEVNNVDIFRFDNIPYIFYKISEPRLVGYQVPWARFISFESKEYLIYKDMSIIFQASCEADDIKVDINGSIIPKEENRNINYDIYLYSKENNDYCAYKILIRTMQSGYNRLKIINGVTGKIIKNCDFYFLYDDSIEKKFISKNEKGNIYQMTTNMLKESLEFLFPYGCSYQKYDAFAKNIGPGELIVYASVISYSIDGTNWFDLDAKCYLPKIPNTSKIIKICGPDNMSAYYYDAISKTNKKAILVHTDDPFIYELEVDLFRKISNQKNVKVIFEFGKKYKYLMIWLNPFIDKNYVNYYNKNDKKHYFSIHFEGADKVHYRIKPLNEETILSEGDVSSDELFTIDKYVIPHNIMYLSVSLHRKKYGSLFAKYEDESFYTFPRYCLKGIDIRFKEKPFINCDNKSYQLQAKVDINIDTKLKIEVVDAIYNTLVFSDTISNGENKIIELKKEVFNSYIIKYYSPLDLACNDYVDSPIFVSKPIEMKSWYMSKFFFIDKFLLENGETKEVENLLNFNQILSINNDLYLSGNIINKYGAKVVSNVCCKKFNIDNKELELQVSIYKDNKWYILKSGNTKIKSLHIKLGGKK